MPSPSLKLDIVTRLTLLWTALFAVGLGAFTALAWAGIVREQYEALDIDLSSTATFAARRIAQHSGLTVQDLQQADAPDAALVIVRDGSVDHVGAKTFSNNIIVRLRTMPLNRGVTLTDGEATRAYAVSLGGQPNARVIAIASTRTLQDEQRRTGYGFGVAALPILIFAVVMGVVLARRSLAPIKKMRSVAAQIAREGTFSRRLNVHGSDELALLASTFDEMLGRLEQSFAREQAFIGDVSHELRNSLGAIIGEGDLALAKPDDSNRYGDALSAIVRRARRLAGTVDDLLLLARADAGALPHTELVDLNELATRVAAEVQQRNTGPAITLSLSDDPISILARSELLARVIENLLVNARHAARSRVALQITQRRDSAALHVDDDGAGVPESDRDAIFRRFRRGKAGYAGSGLGLALVRAIIGAYGGTVSVGRSALGGASFVVELPLPK